MSDTQIPTPQQKNGWESVWPALDDTSTTSSCAALFIDIRDSSKMSAGPDVSSDDTAKQISVFLDTTRELLREGFQKQKDSTGLIAVPDMVKSLGDGLFCVWDFKDTILKRRIDRKKFILRAVLYLNKRIGKSLQEQWGVEKLIETGMGLAFGPASKATVNNSPDYLGYVANLAAKLQGFARPRGVVVDAKFVGGSFASEQGLVRRRFLVPMLEQPELECYATKLVRRVHKWTCLAWPGLVIDHSDESSHRPGLNAKGITVVTHEGLQGKIGTLRIWPRNETPDDHQNDPFEIIIDDFDRLSIMSKDGTVDLVPVRMVRLRGLGRMVSPALLKQVEQEHEKFLFIPIRCGLNALAWNTAALGDLAGINRYSDILSKIDQFGPVGLYDSAGISFPVLLRCLEQNSSVENPFDAAPEDFVALEALLTERQAYYQRQTGRPDKRLFLLYQTVEELSEALQSGQSGQSGNGINVVFGGGAWLTNPGDNDDSTITSCIPKNDLGFLWIEGAALQGPALQYKDTEIRQIIDFFKEEILARAYQIALITAKPYGATPVNAEVLNEMLLLQNADFRADGPPSVAHSSLIDEGKKSISTLFQDPNRTGATFAETKILMEALSTPAKKTIVLRRKPKYLEEWRKCWDTIRDKFCDKMEI